MGEGGGRKGFLILLLTDKTVILVVFWEGRDASHGLWRLQAVEHLREESSLRPLAPLRWQLALFVLMLRVADDAARLLDPIVDHGDDGVIRNTAFAWTVIVQHVAGPKPALLHALPRKRPSDHDAWREIGH